MSPAEALRSSANAALLDAQLRRPPQTVDDLTRANVSPSALEAAQFNRGLSDPLPVTLPAGERPSLFSILGAGARAGFTDSIRGWAAIETNTKKAGRFLSSGLYQPVLIEDQDEWELVMGPASKYVTFEGGRSKTEWELRRRQFYQEQVADYLSSTPGIAPSVAGFAGQLIGGIPSFSNIAAMTVVPFAAGQAFRFATGTTIRAATTAAAFGDTTRISASLLLAARVSNGRLGGFYRGALETVPTLPADLYLQEVAGGPEYTPMDVAATMILGGATRQFGEFASGQWHKLKRERSFDAEIVEQYANTYRDPLTPVQRLVFNEAAKRGSDISPKQIADNWGTIETMAGKGELSLEALAAFKPKQKGVSEDRLAADALEKLIDDAGYVRRAAADRSPEFNVLTDKQKWRDADVEFATSLDQAIFAVGRGDEIALDRVGKMLERKGIVGSVSKELRDKIKAVGDAYVNKVEARIDELGWANGEPVGTGAFAMRNIANSSKKNFHAKVMDAPTPKGVAFDSALTKAIYVSAEHTVEGNLARADIRKLTALTDEQINDARNRLRHQEKTQRSYIAERLFGAVSQAARDAGIVMDLSKSDALFVADKLIGGKKLSDADTRKAFGQLADAYTRGELPDINEALSPIELTVADARLPLEQGQRISKGTTLSLRGVDAVNDLMDAIETHYRDIPDLHGTIASTAMPKGAEATIQNAGGTSATNSDERLARTMDMIEDSPALTPEGKDDVKAFRSEVGQRIGDFLACLNE